MSMSGLAMRRASLTTCAALTGDALGTLQIQVGHHGDGDASFARRWISSWLRLSTAKGAGADNADAQQADLDGLHISNHGGEPVESGRSCPSVNS